jgi:uncharacterized membrane protein YgcG
MPTSRFLRALAVVAIATASLLIPTAALASASAPSAAMSALSSSAVGADVDDFSYASWDARFVLGVDDDRRATMRVTETLTARFPDVDQNRGIVRGLPTSYQGSSLHLDVISVTDQGGAAVPYDTEEDDGVLYISVGDDSYVHGLTTYVIDYEMRDVVLAADPSAGSGEHGVDEFYWDLLPLESTQPIDRFSAEIVLDDTMAAGLNGNARCYTGYAGSTDECDLTRDGSTFGVQGADLAAGEGVTVAIGFESGTVAQPSARMDNPVTDTVPALAALGGVGASLAGWIAVSLFKSSRRKATGIVVAQYDVPDSLPPLVAAAVLPHPKDVMPAEIVHLAVRGTLRIEESAPRPRLRRLPGARIPDQLDVTALDALYVGADADGAVELPAASESFAARMNLVKAAGVDAAGSRGLTSKARSRIAVVLQSIGIAIVAIGVALSVVGVISGRESAIPGLVASVFGLFLVGFSCFYSFAKHVVLTPAGATTYEYLQGVREFIRVAEADRLRMLQSYTGAERRQDGSANVIVVYEHLLPYAMLFGMEKEWGEVLEFVYAHEQRGAPWIGDPSRPFVYSQLSAFSASSGAASSYTAPSSSSSSGGSFGGGFSGGGGGGGFSGGR